MFAEAEGEYSQMQNEPSLSEARRRAVQTGAATLVGAGALATGNAAHAQVNVVNLSVPLTATTSTNVFFNVLDGTAATGSLAGAEYELTHTSSGGTETSSLISLDPNSQFLAECSSPNVVKLAQGTVVGPPAFPFNGYASSTTDTLATTGSPSGEWFPGNSGYAGLDVQSGSDHHYGWAELTIGDGTNGAAPYDVTLTAFGYNAAPNQAVLAGTNIAVTAPEPSALELMVVGVAGLGALRLRRRTIAA